MAKLPFYGGEGFGDGRIRADVKLKCFDGKVGEGRCRGFGLWRRNGIPYGHGKKGFGGELFGDPTADTLIGATDKHNRLRRGHSLDGCFCSSRRILE